MADRSWGLASAVKGTAAAAATWRATGPGGRGQAGRQAPWQEGKQAAGGGRQRLQRAAGCPASAHMRMPTCGRRPTCRPTSKRPLQRHGDDAMDGGEDVIGEAVEAAQRGAGHPVATPDDEGHKDQLPDTRQDRHACGGRRGRGQGTCMLATRMVATWHGMAWPHAGAAHL